MAIIETDIKLIASERLNDDADGGGFMTGTVVPDGVENNLFPDISDADRVFGRVQLRKCYVSVASADTDTYLGAHVILDDYPDDPAASALLVTKPGYSQERADVVSALDNSNYKVASNAAKKYISPAVLTAGVTTTFTVDLHGGTDFYYWNGVAYVLGFWPGDVEAGDILGLFTVNAASPIPALSEMEVVRIASVTRGRPCNVTLTRPVQRTYNASYTAGDPDDYAVILTQDTGNGALLFYGETTTTGALAIGASTLPVVSTWGQFIPVASGGVYPTVDASILGTDPANYAATGGRVGIFRPDEACVVHHTINEAPRTVANAQSIDLLRIRLAKVRVFGNDGIEITVGWTANLTTGVITFNNVAGYSQPVVIRHRIEDMLLVSSALEQSLLVARPVTHAFPSGSRVSSVLMFGDLQARSHTGFGQVTWTGVFSDTLIGSATVADFNEAVNPITVTNKGALTERWACVFTNSTTFNVIGEQVGQILVGNTGSPTAPLNPATLEPYFTIPAAGWGAGWAAGNVYRFNTSGANAPVWVIRSIAPSDPFVGQDSMTLAIRGNVNA